MTTEQIEMTRVIAEYDGWVESNVQPTHGRMVLYTKEDFSQWLGSFSYLTFLDWLHPVAMKVMDEIEIIINIGKDADSFVEANSIRRNMIIMCYRKPINGQYIDYFVGVNEDYVDKQKLPEGEWSIHCHSNTVTEQQAAEIVTNEGTEKQPMYTDYTHPFSGYTNAIPSLATLVDAHDITTPYIVLKLKQDAPQQPIETKRKRKTKKTQQ